MRNVDRNENKGWHLNFIGCVYSLLGFLIFHLRHEYFISMYHLSPKTLLRVEIFIFHRCLLKTSGIYRWGRGVCSKTFTNFIQNSKKKKKTFFFSYNSCLIWCENFAVEHISTSHKGDGHYRLATPAAPLLTLGLGWLPIAPSSWTESLRAAPGRVRIGTCAAGRPGKRSWERENELREERKEEEEREMQDKGRWHTWKKQDENQPC